jgi:tellurite resistance protein TerC
MATNVWYWIAFGAFVLLLLALDLGVFHRRAEKVNVKQALLWSAFFISLAVAFNLGIYFIYGGDKALEFMTGYLIEQSLSVDNLFVFAVVFSYFAIPPKYQHRILFWGILGALFMRATMIGVGTALIDRFHWLIYVFGAFLIYTGIKLALRGEEPIEPEKNLVIRLARKVIPILPRHPGGEFFVRQNGKRYATPLFLALLVIEVSDLIFAVDSIPAIFAITTDPFVVYTSNVFAILGLRSLYFALAAILTLFHYLKYGLSVVLVFVGVKMVGSPFFHIPIGIALGVVAGILLLSVVASWLWPPKEVSPDAAPDAAPDAPSEAPAAEIPPRVDGMSPAARVAPTEQSRASGGRRPKS